MRAIGLDIGTTTICAVVVDGSTGAIVDSITENNDSLFTGGPSWEKLQEPSAIYNKVLKILEELIRKYVPISCIGVTGQMHGIVYIDENGNAVSPLYNWQDGRGDILYEDGRSYAEYLSNKTKYKLATGYGAVTHFYNLRNSLVPAAARFICTIHDYIAMKLAQCTIPNMNSSNAASLGLFNLDANCFDNDAICSAGMDETLFPFVSKGAGLLGTTVSNIPVAIAIGDNQASFLGSVKNRDESILVNVGTGSQISVFTDGKIHCPCVETRPFPDNGYLLVGASLCGGSAYALLEKFFRSVVFMVTGKESGSLYDLMDKSVEELINFDNKLEVSTRFMGTRDNPSLRGAIGNIGMDNFTPRHFTLGILEGIAGELQDIYGSIVSVLEKKPAVLVGSGNGIRKNMLLQRVFSKMFDMTLCIPVYKEEAAYGAALYALTAIGYFNDSYEAQSMIRYQ
jgi:sedoheptulokinase